MIGQSLCHHKRIGRQSRAEQAGQDNIPDKTRNAGDECQASDGDDLAQHDGGSMGRGCFGKGGRCHIIGIRLDPEPLSDNVKRAAFHLGKDPANIFADNAKG